MPTPDSKSLSDIHTPIEPDFDPTAALQQAAAQRAAASDDSLSDGKTTGGIVGDSTSSADLKAAADHLDDVEFEFVDLTRLYDIFEPLGEGGMGTVYRAIEKQSRHLQAIKRLKSDLVTNRRARARFQSEGNAMLKLTHENIVRFFRMGCDADSPFYVMELVAGGSLKDRLEQGKLELDEAIRMFVALAGGLSLSHRSGIIHRDIKPGNILLTLDGVPKLSDFGIARQVEGSGLTSTGAAMGTPFYMAPEQHKDGKTATELSDLYSLAATLYHAVTGELPISVRESRIPEPIREITLKALEADPSQRQPSVAVFGAELRSVQMQLSGPASATDDAAQLKAGECPHCHTINPLTRKFCKAKGCGTPLVEPCPKCETNTPVWEAICAECGTDIPAHWEAAEQDLENQAQQIETLAAEQRYADALEALKPFHSLTHSPWKAWKDWASEMATTYQAQLAQQQAHRDKLFIAAQDKFKAAKYSQAISLLDQIHPLQLTQEVRSMRSRATAYLEELGQLIRTIKSQVAAKEYNSLRKSVDRFLTISPSDQRVVKLDGELRVREEAAKRKQEQLEIERQKQESLPATPHVDNTSMVERLRKTRESLLDLSRRNRLINCPKSSSRSKQLDIVDERSDEVFRMLVVDGRAFSFLAGAGDKSGNDTSDNGIPLLPPPEEMPNSDLADRHLGTKLQTRLPPKKLQDRLLGLYYDARTSEEEQGVSSLFLAVGFLEWYESDASDKSNFAPLILLPVDLERSTARSQFRLRFREEELSANLSLQSKLREFNISLPDFPDEGLPLKPSEYFQNVKEAVGSQPRWRIHPNEMTLWFFSFAKYLMYRDLAPESWPVAGAITNNETIQRLFGNRESTSESPLFGDDENMDNHLSTNQVIHVMDADSSQSAVIEEVRRGRNLVVQGPPGTGKSQTITNILASAVADGKKVLFVCEKMAALEVVRGRLEHIGLGAMCVELHSHKANKKDFLKDLDKTLQLTQPHAVSFSEQKESLELIRNRLNSHAKVMNTPVASSELTPYQILGNLVNYNSRGIRSSKFQIKDLAEITPAVFREQVNVLEDLKSALRDTGALSEHPWRGVRLSTPLLPSDKERVREVIEEIRVSLQAMKVCGERIGKIAHVGVPADPNPSWFEKQLPLFHVLCDTPEEMDQGAIAHDAWNGQQKKISEIVDLGLWLKSKLQRLSEVFTDEAWTFNLNPVRRAIVGHGRSWFRFLNGEYRAAVSTLSGLLQCDLPRTYDERRELVDDMIAAQKGHGVFEGEQSQVVANAFGLLWRGIDSDFTVLKRIVDWESASRKARVHEHFRKITSGISQRPQLREAVRLLETELSRLPSLLLKSQQLLQPESGHILGKCDVQKIAVSEVNHVLAEWSGSLDRLPQWVGMNIRLAQLETVGLAEVRGCLESNLVSGEDVVDQYRHAYFEGLLRRAYSECPSLSQFSGLSQDQWIAEFRKLDLQSIENSRVEVSLAHLSVVHGNVPAKQMALIKREIEKKMRHIPIRRLLKEAGQAVQAIKPVFMMSPISISQYLEPGALEFDLLVMDEASQITPEDALGSLARCKQVVVVGDSKQLPPTSFFRKTAEDDDEDDDTEVKASNIESILGMCRASGLPERMLRWHYRSQHESLIAVSNKEFYDNRLYIVPSPSQRHEQLGLRFRHFPQGRFGRGTTTSNVIEAREVAEAVMTHAKLWPTKSLGVAAFSVSQRNAIRDELELLRREDPSVESFFAMSGPNEFFVKNLENIQGDERDVIMISVGYAKPESGGELSMAFGPLSSEGGERRLNVLITRARERCEVFSSITHDDIDLSRAKSRGVAAFKTFLRYAATGILDSMEATGKDFDSEFEREVHRAISESGFTVHTQVGTAGFRIDLAVVDPDQPGRYLLGIECDGATYHSSRSARDRDRLRQAVLESRGWTIHRIWSTDWFQQPEAQLRNVLNAIGMNRISTTGMQKPSVPS